MPPEASKAPQTDLGKSRPHSKNAKSRSGCQTCKARRLKCDETRPACRHCVRKGVPCPGYPVILRWTTKYERVRKPAATTVDPAHFSRLASAVSDSIRAPSDGASGAPSTPTIFLPAYPLLDDGATHQPDVPIPSVERHTPDTTECGPGATGTQHSVFAPSPSEFSLDNNYSQMPSAQTQEAVQDAADDVYELPTPGSSDQLALALKQHEPASYTVPPSLVDVPTFLVDHWFRSVCSTWSAFDSQANPYRKLASSLLTSSMSVFYAIQSMAAASLVENVPHIRDSALQSRQLAITSLDSELRLFHHRRKNSSSAVFPRSLLISLFCMSSSISWMDAGQLGLHLLRQARAVLGTLNGQTGVLNGEDRAFLDFFNGCLTYEDMVRSIVTDNSSTDADIRRWTWPTTPTTSQSQLSVAFHAWTGVSPDLLRLFARSMVLCRRARNRLRRPDSRVTEAVVLEITADYRRAANMEEVLLAIEMPGQAEGDAGVDTEEGALRAHLRNASEAFRLCALHQLYETFPDLLAKRLPDQASHSGTVPHSRWLDPLALHVADILRHIPPTSRMRCLQPILCLYAGCGLRLDEAVSSENVGADPNPDPDPDVVDPDMPSPDSGVFSPSLGGTDFHSPRQSNVEIARARLFVQRRLSALEALLPSKTTTMVAKQLLVAVWAEYDAELGSSPRTHWLDVMDRTGLHSLFG